jgi:hypothetical protein
MSKQLPHALIVGIVAAFAIFTSNILSIPAWTIFVGWVSYFVFATNAQQGLLCFIHLVIGLVLAALVIITSTYLSAYLPDIALIMVVFTLAATLTFTEPLRNFNNIPAYYIGMIVLFASALSPDFSVLFKLSFSLAIGLCLGYFTVFIRTKLTTISHN